MAASFLDRCAALYDAHPQQRIVVFVPHSQLGRALHTAMARRCTDRGLLGWEAVTPTDYATSCARLDLASTDARRLPAHGRRFFMDALLADLDGTPAFDHLPSSRRFVRILAQSIHTLRMNAVAPADLRDRANTRGRRLQAVAAGYARYVEALDEHTLYDGADVFRWATERTEAHGVPEGTVFAVCDSVDLPGWPLRFLRALQTTGAPFYRLGADTDYADPPATVAAHYVADVPYPAVESPTATTSSTHFRKTVGTLNEVRGVLRDILESGAPLDEIEIAYTSSTPYLPLLADEAERLDLPMTLGPGAPADTSRAGQRLRGMYDWITNGYDPAVLISLLRSGHIRLDALSLEEDTDSLEDDTEDETTFDPASIDAPTLATTLAGQHYATGRSALPDALEHALAEINTEIDARDPSSDTTHLQDRRDRLQAALHFVEMLLTWFGGRDEETHDAAPPQLTVADMAVASLKVLDRLGRTVDDDEAAEDDLDVTAHKVLRTTLERLQSLPFPHEAPLTRLAALFRDVVCGQYVRAETPEPGSVHVLPLDSAGFNGRPNLYVVGMDSATLSTAPVDDPLLRDDDLSGISDVLDGDAVPSAADTLLWQMETALDRHEGPTTLYRCAFDLHAGEERFPSSLYLRRQRQHAADASEPLLDFVPGSDRLALDDDTAWLMARVAPDAGPSSAREALHAAFPHLQHGEHATAQRQGPTVTAHDGRLTDGPFPELDFRDEAFSGPLSSNQLERFAESPYAYFIMHVLDVQPLDEPALDDEAWLSPLRRGSILHKTFEMFLTPGCVPTPADEEALKEAFTAAFEEETARHAPPSEIVEAAARRQLWADVQLFFRVECEEAATFTPRVLEWSVGMPPHRRNDHDGNDHDGPSRFTLHVGDLHLPFRGKVDRVDTHADGSLAVWDYKSGSRRFEPSEPLEGGSTLQWALYAYAVEQELRTPVRRAGYYYATTREMGVRLHANPQAYRDDVAALLNDLAERARSGDFTMSSRAHEAATWRFGTLQRICPDVNARRKQIRTKHRADG